MSRPVLLLAGPPAASGLWRRVAPRIPGAMATELLDPHLDSRLAAVAERLSRSPAWPDATVVAHGLATPAAILAATLRPCATLVLSNGPLRGPDPVARGFAVLVARMPLHPALWLRLLASSVALRRTVNNPYAMDRDTVALLCGPLVATSGDRDALRAYLGSLAGDLPSVEALRCRVGLVWGGADRLYPTSEAAWAETRLPRVLRRDIPGGRHFHIEEQPWAFADAVLAIHGARVDGDPSGQKSHA